MDIKSYFKPNGMKILLSFLLLIPSWFIIALLFAFLSTGNLFAFLSTGNFYVGLVLGILIAYILGCMLDSLIISKPIKIGIAILAGIISTYISFQLLKTFVGGSVSEYAHVPSECELACREIYEKATNRTSEVMDKVRECMNNCK